jgi:LmbE family N-acetylglucosaminyl deacetylase
MKQITRRHLLTRSGIAAASVLPIATSAAESPPNRALRILVAGGHPGDPEAGCGGTIARFADQGHVVTCLYLTRGQAGIPGKTAKQAADIRSAEAESACKILKARAVFADQTDGATEVTPARYAEFTKLITAVNPDLVLTQWPVDGHRDHRTCSLLTFEAWINSGKKFALYYYEVDLGTDTQCFRPTHYVDVAAVEPLKRKACMAHQSQNPTGFYLQDHVPMLRFRGMECGCKLAEAFIHHDQSPSGGLPV